MFKSLHRAKRGAVVLRRMGVGATLLVLLSPTAAFASHFRYGNSSWRPGAGANTIDFQISEAWRRSAYSGTAADGYPTTGDVVQSDDVIDFGDGSNSNFDLLVTSVDVVNDWMFGVALDPARPAGDKTDTLVGHTYPNAGTFTMNVSGCCRVGQTSINWHVNNPDGSQKVATTVVVGGGNRAAVSTLPPIVQCPITGVCSFQVPASDPDGDPLRYRFASASEAGGGFTQPGPPYSTNAAAINATTGQYTWDTAGATLGPAGSNTLYSTQVVIEDLDGAGNVKSQVAVDFLIQLVTVVGSPPVFNQPPSPVCGSTINTKVGRATTFTVQASDPDASNTVTLNAAGLPPGTTMTPALPTTGAAGAPVASNFSWTPTASQVGTYVMTFQATDNTGQQALCSYTIVVTPRPAAASTNVGIFRPPTGQWFVRGGAPEVSQYGEPCSFPCVNGDIPVYADFNGDGVNDLAVYRPYTGQWFIQGASPEVIAWGATPCVLNVCADPDIPVPADYDGDGKADIAVYRPSTGQWLVRGGSPEVVQYGESCGFPCVNGDIPVPADYNGDGRADFAVFRPNTAQWFIQGGNPEVVQYGQGCVNTCRDVPVPADYDGDGRADIAVFRGTTGQWFIRGGSPEVVNYGSTCSILCVSPDIPVPGDYDHDGRADIAVYRPMTGQWFIRGGSPETFSYGEACGLLNCVSANEAGARVENHDIPISVPYAIRRAVWA